VKYSGKGARLVPEEREVKKYGLLNKFGQESSEENEAKAG
jgi:hypothetical protein